MRKRTALLRSGVVALVSAALGACILQLPSPYVRVEMKSAYNETDILIPYEIYGESGFARARWTIEYFDVFGDGVWELQNTREVRIPSGSSGVLELGALDQGRYRVEIALLTTRSGSFEQVPYLTVTEEFYVDRERPTTPDDGDPYDYYFIDGGFIANSTAPAPAPDDLVAGRNYDVEYSGISDWTDNFESPVSLLVNPGGPAVLTPEDHGQGDLRFTVEDMGAQVYYVQAIDEAGNRGDVEVLTFHDAIPPSKHRRTDPRRHDRSPSGPRSDRPDPD